MRYVVTNQDKTKIMVSMGFYAHRATVNWTNVDDNMVAALFAGEAEAREAIEIAKTVVNAIDGPYLVVPVDQI